MTLIKHKKSSTPSAIPSVNSLELGEFAINTRDGKAFFKKYDGVTESMVEIANAGNYYLKSEIDSFFAGSAPINGYNKSNWDTAYMYAHGHSNLGVLDGITSTLVARWNQAFGWGNHALAGYQPGDSDLTAIAELSGTGYLYRNAITGWSLQAISGGDSYDGFIFNQALIGGINATSGYQGIQISQGSGISISGNSQVIGGYSCNVLTITNSAPFPGFGTTSSVAARGNHTHTLDSLSNVTISAPIAVNSLLAYNGSAWVNKTASELGLGGGGATTRTLTWVIKNPAAGTIVGPRLYLNDGYIKRVTGSITGGTSVSFNVQARTAPNTAVSNIGSNMSATTSGSNTTFNYYVDYDKYLTLIINSVSGTVAYLTVTVAFEEA